MFTLCVSLPREACYKACLRNCFGRIAWARVAFRLRSTFARVLRASPCCTWPLRSLWCRKALRSKDVGHFTGQTRHLLPTTSTRWCAKLEVIQARRVLCHLIIARRCLGCAFERKLWQLRRGFTGQSKASVQQQSLLFPDLRSLSILCFFACQGEQTRCLGFPCVQVW